MKFLVTGGRSPYTLDLIRSLYRQGHEVISVEFFHGHLSYFSNAILKNYIITSPVKNFKKFEYELIEIIRSEKVDMVIPTCEEVFHLARIQHKIKEHCKPFFEEISALEKFHHKNHFINGLKERSMVFPKTLSFDKYDGELKGKDVILKKKFSRFGTEVINTHESKLESHKIENKSEWIIQEFVEGKELSIFCILFEGQLQVVSSYEKNYCFSGGPCIYFENRNDELVFGWVNQYFKDSSHTGFFAFDLILKDNLLYAIECNPRCTSGVHLVTHLNEFSHLFINKRTDRVKVLEDKYMLEIPMILSVFSYITSFSKWYNDFRSAKDVIRDRADLLPFIFQAYTFIYFLFVSLVKQVSFEKATTIDIEYSGEKTLP